LIMSNYKNYAASAEERYIGLVHLTIATTGNVLNVFTNTQADQHHGNSQTMTSHNEPRWAVRSMSVTAWQHLLITNMEMETMMKGKHLAYDLSALEPNFERKIHGAGLPLGKYIVIKLPAYERDYFAFHQVADNFYDFVGNFHHNSIMGEYWEPIISPHDLNCLEYQIVRSEIKTLEKEVKNSFKEYIKGINNIIRKKPKERDS